MSKHDLTNPDIVRHFQKRARHVAIRRGYPELADDFAGEIFVSFIEKPDRGATIDQLFIDFLRRTHGRPGTPGGDARIAGELHALSLDAAAAQGEDGPLLHELIGYPSDHSEPERGDGDFAFCFRGRAAELYHAVYVEECSEVSVSERFGVSTSRISQMLGEIKAAIRRQSILRDGYERMEWDDSFLNFSIQWVVI